MGAGSGTTGWASLISPAMTAIGGFLQHQAAGDATDAMVAGANNGIAENGRQFDTVMKLLQPYISAGTRGLDSYEALAGTKGAAAQQQAIAGLEGSPEYAAYLSEGEEAILANAAATGGLRGGNTQGALMEFRPQLLASLIDRKLGHYGMLASTGQSSATGAGSAAMTTGGNNSKLLQQIGAAESGGILAGSNAIVNTLGNVGGFFAGYGGGGGVPPNPNVQPGRMF